MPSCLEKASIVTITFPTIVEAIILSPGKITGVASIISKKDSQLEIIDAVTFDTINADISPELLEQASENDSVTYIQFEDTIRVIEVRKS